VNISSADNSMKQAEYWGHSE